jgi:hypothetical protein
MYASTEQKKKYDSSSGYDCQAKGEIHGIHCSPSLFPGRKLIPTPQS